MIKYSAETQIYIESKLELINNRLMSCGYYNF